MRSRTYKERRHQRGESALTDVSTTIPTLVGGCPSPGSSEIRSNNDNSSAPSLSSATCPPGDSPAQTAVSSSKKRTIDDYFSCAEDSPKRLCRPVSQPELRPTGYAAVRDHGLDRPITPPAERKTPLPALAPLPRSSRSEGSRTRTPHRKLSQLVLDLGQRNAGLRSCKGCGMSYAETKDEDRAIHSRYHSAAVRGIEFPGYANELVVEAGLESGASRIILINAESSLALKRKRAEILDVVERDLGAAPLSEALVDRCQTFVHVSSKHVIGCVVAEPQSENAEWVVFSSTAVLPSVGIVDSDELNLRKSSTSSSQGIDKLPLCGISRIWVSREHRRKGIASRLLDVVRRRFLFGCTLSKSQLAFSQPTNSGQQLAAAYLGGSDFFVYSAP
ncbi:ESCO1/2 acetyl-transferase-domain-containing protein [Zopfochytrium polystomum]|nr:ESCO1/2 acetyl-transferase-domain-containing protein [Zopfochytrium polystomum]